MALFQLNSLTKFHPHTLFIPKRCPFGRRDTKIVVSATNEYLTQTCDAAVTQRRSANYKPNIWEHDFMKTLTSDYTGELYLQRAHVLKDKVRQLLDHMHYEKCPLALLQLIDDIQRLGLGHIFEEDIQRVLSFLNENNLELDGSLHATALNFRLFRQHGFAICQDVFKVFKDTRGNFMEHLSQDVMGILNLYEASYYAEEGECILDEAKAFARRHLKDVKGNLDPSLAELVNHALDLPLNLRIPRLEARWYIDAFSRRKDTNSNLLELAKLDYNMVQAAHQKDVIDMSQWWLNLGLPTKLPFARDRLVECFLWSIGVAYEPQYKYCREGVTKLCILLTTIDDIYDVYATFDEAKLFTEAVQRWDVNTVEQLPDYMKLCFLALYSTVNEMAYDILKEQGLNIIPLLKKTVEDQFKSFLLEAKWFNTGYKPTLEEYLDNACISLGGPLVLFHTYFFLRPEVTKEALTYLESYPNLIRWSSMILRLTDDMGTSKAELERGDVLKSVQCYMHHNDVTEKEAREHIRHLTDEAWKKLNAELWVDSPLPREFIKLVVNWARTAETTYQYEDGHGVPDKETKSRVLSLLVDAVPVKY